MNHESTAPLRLRQDLALVPITAVGFLRLPSPRGEIDAETLLLVGEHTRLNVYESRSGRFCCQFGVFRSQPIHGIATDGDYVLVWGNRSLAIFSTQVIEDRISREVGRDEFSQEPVIYEAQAPDWIYDGLIVPGEEGVCRVVLVTAHNEVLEAYKAPGGQLTFGRVISPTRPSLYSAKVTPISDSEVLVAAGTVFGEIIVWKCCHAPDLPLSFEVLFVFSGHEGSIYGVDLSPEVIAPDGTKERFLASCSDDRTVRIWDVSDRSATRATVQANFSDARETGFGGDPLGLGPVADASSGPLAVGIGHVSRVWDVKFATQLWRGGDDQVSLSVYTFGEDATAIKWQLDIDFQQWVQPHTSSEEVSVEKPVKASLVRREGFSYHEGKHIWASAVADQGDDGGILIATGGADGKVNIITDATVDGVNDKSVFPGSSTLPPELQILTFQAILDQLPPTTQTYSRTKRGRNETLLQFSFISSNTFLAVSNSGRVLLGTLDGAIKWSNVELGEVKPDDLALCTSLATPGPGMALIGTTSRKLFLYRGASLLEIASLPGKVSEIFCLDPAQTGSDCKAFGQNGTDPTMIEVLVFMIGAPEVLQLVRIDTSSNSVKSIITVPGQRPGYVTTSACLLGNILIVGSRHGHLGFYQRVGSQLTFLTYAERRTNDTITSITPLPLSSESHNGRAYFLATCRDGHYRIYEVHGTKNMPDIRVHLRHETFCPSIPVIEGAWLTSTNDESSTTSGDLILYGFRGKNFIAWNETQRCEVIAVDCGGGHRVFSYRPRDLGNAGQLHFAFNKASSLGVLSQADGRMKTVKTGTHGREIRAVACSGRYVATGSEDTSIGIWEHVPHPSTKGGNLRRVAAMKAHEAGLQSMKWLAASGEDFLFSCAGNEEFMIWRVGTLEGAAGQFVSTVVRKEAEFDDRSPSRDLRIMDFDVTATKPRHEDDAAASSSENNLECLISMAFSNSVFKTYEYRTSTGFKLLAEGKYTGACLTQIRHLRVGSDDGVFETLIAASDGHVSVWTAGRMGTVADTNVKAGNGPPMERPNYGLAAVAMIHQSSVKALKVVFLAPDRNFSGKSEGNFVVLTGGDDNALGITTFCRDSDGGGYSVTSKTGVKSAHAAAINGLSILSRGALRTDGPQTRHEGIVFATVSNDQRLRIWKVRLGIRGGHENGPGAGITLLADKDSGVADPGDVDVYEADDDVEGTKVVIAGVGMEIWTVEAGKEVIIG